MVVNFSIKIAQLIIGHPIIIDQDQKPLECIMSRFVIHQIEERESGSISTIRSTSSKLRAQVHTTFQLCIRCEERKSRQVRNH